MSNKFVYNEKPAGFSSIAEEQVGVPGRIPGGVYIREAEADNFYVWCRGAQGAGQDIMH